MLRMQDSNHFPLFNDQYSGRDKRSRCPYPTRLTGHASLAKEIARSQKRHDGLFAVFIDY